MSAATRRTRRTAPAPVEPPSVRDALEGWVPRLAGRRVVVLGDLVADEFVHGDIARVSREAPVLILEHRRTMVVPGGAGNAVANLRALEAEPLPVGVVGRDAAGTALLRQLRELGVTTGGILRERGYDTPTKSRIIAGGVHTRRQQVVRIDRGAGHGELPQPAKASLGEALGEALSGADGLLVADYGYGAAVPELVVRTLREARRAGLPVLVDSRTRVARYRRATACTPNQEELERAVGSGPLEDTPSLDAAAAALLARTGDRAVLVTRGARGMALYERHAPPVHIPAFGSDEVADVTGAGDTVIAVFALGVLAGASFEEAARLANVAAGLVVMKAGTATVRPEELVRALREDLEGAGRTPSPVADEAS